MDERLNAVVVFDGTVDGLTGGQARCDERFELYNFRRGKLERVERGVQHLAAGARVPARAAHLLDGVHDGRVGGTAERVDE